MLLPRENEPLALVPRRVSTQSDRRERSGAVSGAIVRSSIQLWNAWPLTPCGLS
jgi:hypothetical protein